MKPSAQRQTNLTAHVIEFCRFLRGKGFDIGPNEEMDVLQSYQTKVPASFEEQQHLFKAVFVKNRKQHLRFDELYLQFWKERSLSEDSKIKQQKEASQVPAPKQQAPSIQVLKDWLYAGRISEEKEVAAYSAFEAIGKKDFSSFLSSEQKELLAIIRLIAKQLAQKESRRYVRSSKKKQVDLKNTIRQSLRNGLEINQFLFREKQERKVKLILICDVSKSMELYSQFLIEFMYSFQQVVHQLHSFIFSTRLVSLSKILRDSDFEKVLNNLSDQVPYWSGGTRIGASLQTFKETYGDRLLGKDSIVLILSDGWDTGDLSTLEHSMQHIHKKADRVIWLNPLAGNPDYKPETKGMEVCMPYIDIFTSAHNLESLRGVVRHLKKRRWISL